MCFILILILIDAHTYRCQPVRYVCYTMLWIVIQCDCVRNQQKKRTTKNS